jgi:hypothetical protein
VVGEDPVVDDADAVAPRGAGEGADQDGLEPRRGPQEEPALEAAIDDLEVSSGRPGGGVEELRCSGRHPGVLTPTAGSLGPNASLRATASSGGAAELMIRSAP